jgi:aminoglycoside phosphotransferase (APT) family kinase protein
MTIDDLDELTRRARAVSASVDAVLHHTDKAIVAAGHHDGRPVVIKLITTTDPYWRLRRSHEIHVYRRFAAHPPPVRAPRLIHDDGDTLMLLTKLPGVRLHDARHVDTDLSAATVAAILGAVNTVPDWQPATPPAAVIADYPGRVDAEYAAGLLDDLARETIRALLTQCGHRREIQHGDPLPANLLLDRQDCGLADWEFAGLYLPVLWG